MAPTARTPATQTARSPRRGDDIDRVVIQTGAVGGALQFPRAMLVWPARVLGGSSRA